MRQCRFDSFFQAATNNPPYGYQCRLACGDDARPDKPETLAAGCECRSQLINVPTGLGKTAGVVLAWLWNRFRIQNRKSKIRNSERPRRLVYCLPGRAMEGVGLWTK